ncbi:MAG: hypothetical protein ABR562_08220, partial [Thermoplasmatota archaeon]
MVRLAPFRALRYEAARVDLARPVVTTCGSGITASVLALALHRVGRDDVAVLLQERGHPHLLR